MGVTSNGIRVARADEVRHVLPLPPTQSSVGGVWGVDVMSLPSARVSLFAPRGGHGRSVHDEDELYLAISGSAVLQSGSESYEVAVGSAIWVPAGTPHVFRDQTPEFEAWVVWLPAPEAETRTAARRFVTSWLNGEYDSLPAMLTDDFVIVSHDGTEHSGTDALRELRERWLADRPSRSRVEVSDPVVFGDRAVVEWTSFAADGTLVGHGLQILAMVGVLVDRCDNYTKMM